VLWSAYTYFEFLDTVAEMLLAILNCCTREELEESTDEESEEGIGRDENDDARMLQREAIKNKVLAVGRMARVFDLLRSVYLPEVSQSFDYTCG
jgi:hypothetical protein